MEQPTDAVRGSEASLAQRDARLVEADQQLAAILTQAHTSAAGALRRLTEIEDEINSAVQNQDAMAIDTPAGALSFHKFLLAKHQEIHTVVADAYNEDIAAGAQLESLLPQYLSH